MRNHEITRRHFLKGLTLAPFTLSLSIPHFEPKKAYAQTGLYRYREWEDIYRGRWTWDRIVKGTHNVNCWYQGGCNFNIFIKEGIVLREEQVANYPQTNDEVPDFNPKGCQKGCSFSNRMYDTGRIRYPLKRIGRRGEGKWKRISWDEAMAEIADVVIDTLVNEGSDTIVWDIGTNFDTGPCMLGVLRWIWLFDSYILDMDLELGDDHQGAGITWGKIFTSNSADDWFYSDLILIWGGNPLYTQIPNCHFFIEARYNGTKLISISPDYNPSSIHCDLWIPINPGTDAALALSIAQVIIEEGLYNEDFIREQTDLPFLVREDTKRFLRESDLKEGGQEDRFYCFDLSTKKIEMMPQRSLRLEGMIPALEGQYEVSTMDGKKTKLKPVFQMLKERLNEEYIPEKASQICGISAHLIKRLAREIANAKAATSITQSNFSKYYHGDLMERAAILVFALCGHFGKKGSGWIGSPYFTYPDAVESMAAIPPIPPEQGLKELEKQMGHRIKELKEKGYTEEMIIYERWRQFYERKLAVSSVLFFYFNGLKEISGRTEQWDPYLKKDLDGYIEKALRKRWQFVEPKPGKDPKIMFEMGGNIFRRVRGYDRLLKNFLPKLSLLVTVDWRMSNTALHSDFVLPTTGWYEEDECRWFVPITPFYHVTQKAVEPLGESKPEWEIISLLTRKIQQRARERKIFSFKDREGKERKLDRIYDDFSFGHHYTEKDNEKILKDIYKFSSNTDTSWEELKMTGLAKYPRLGKTVEIGSATEWGEHETITPFRWHTQRKMIYPTLTRRMQFYIDHELYLEFGEEMPTHKDNPPIGGNYPLELTGGHTRWSIHTSWRDHAYMLRLQRGGPVIYMNNKDARARNIEDGNKVKVKNDVGSFIAHAKLTGAVRPGQVIIYHAWEPFQFVGHKSHQSLIPSPINPVELAGDYFHLRPMWMALSPGQNDRGTRIEVENFMG